jgi:metal-sulfur cluster biosynthetic enzyme
MSAEQERRAQVMRALDEIHDPCSVSIGVPIGLVGMGIIDEVEIIGERVAVTLLPTFPDCLFRGVFEAKIEEALTAIPWCRATTVSFCAADQGWDESRMSNEARQRLRRPRSSQFARL